MGEELLVPKDQAWADHLDTLAREALLSTSDARYAANFYNTVKAEGVPLDLAADLTRAWWAKAVALPAPPK